MDEKCKENLKQSCLHRWDAWVDKQDLARKVVSLELGARTFSMRGMPWSEECKLIEELVLHLLSNR